MLTDQETFGKCFWERSLGHAGIKSVVKRFRSNLAAAPRKQPRDNPNYRDNQNYAHPDPCFENVSDYLTASEGERQKEQNRKQQPKLFHSESPAGESNRHVSILTGDRSRARRIIFKSCRAEWTDNGSETVRAE
jgi:hypothetical protein